MSDDPPRGRDAITNISPASPNAPTPVPAAVQCCAVVPSLGNLRRDEVGAQGLRAAPYDMPSVLDGPLFVLLPQPWHCGAEDDKKTLIRFDVILIDRDGSDAQRVGRGTCERRSSS